MERGCRLVVVDVVRFVRDLQKHVARTVDRIPSEQRSRTRRRGRTVHRGAFLFFFDDLLLQKSVVVVSIVSFLRRRRLPTFFKAVFHVRDDSKRDLIGDDDDDDEALKEMIL